MATCSAILIENAVLPIAGRPATIIKSPACKPEVFRSKSTKPVEIPVTSSGLSREYSISMRSTTSRNKSGIFKKPCLALAVLSAIRNTWFSASSNSWLASLPCGL